MCREHVSIHALQSKQVIIEKILRLILVPRCYARIRAKPRIGNQKRDPDPEAACIEREEKMKPTKISIIRNAVP